MYSETLRADAREGDIGMQLGEIAKPIRKSRSGAIRSSLAGRLPHLLGVIRTLSRQRPRGPSLTPSGQLRDNIDKPWLL